MNQHAITLSIAGFLAAGVLAWFAAEIKDIQEARQRALTRFATLEAQVIANRERIQSLEAAPRPREDLWRSR